MSKDFVLLLFGGDTFLVFEERRSRLTGSLLSQFQNHRQGSVLLVLKDCFQGNVHRRKRSHLSYLIALRRIENPHSAGERKNKRLLEG
jgi:hypothetical protein